MYTNFCKDHKNITALISKRGELYPKPIFINKAEIFVLNV